MPGWNPTGYHDPLDIVTSVHARVNYLSDLQNEWKTPRFTWASCRGDCEDQNLIVLSALVAEGYEARLVLGDTRKDGKIDHAWCEYREHGIWYVLDATQSARIESSKDYYGKPHRYYSFDAAMERANADTNRLLESVNIWEMR